MSEPQHAALAGAEITSIVRALRAVYPDELTARDGLVAVPRHLLDLSTRERRDLARAGVLVDDGRRRSWVFALELGE